MFAFGCVIQIDLIRFVTLGFNRILFSFITLFIVIFVILVNASLINPSLFIFIAFKSQ